MASAARIPDSAPEVVILDTSDPKDEDNSNKENKETPLPSPSFDLLKSCHSVAVDKWAKKSKQRLTDLTALLPASVTKDRQYVSSINAHLEKRIKSELEEALDERVKDWGIREKLAEIDQIVLEQEKELQGSRPQAWRPSGSPLEDTAAHDIDLVKAATEELQKSLVDPLDKEVGTLMSEVEELRKTIAKNEAEIDAFIAEVKQGQKKK